MEMQWNADDADAAQRGFRRINEISGNPCLKISLIRVPSG